MNLSCCSIVIVSDGGFVFWTLDFGLVKEQGFDDVGLYVWGVLETSLLWYIHSSAVHSTSEHQVENVWETYWRVPC